MLNRQFQHRWGSSEFAHVLAWLPESAPRACVQIVHGMAEHAARYARLGAQLAARGYAVYAQDLPGHGHSVTAPERLGEIDGADGWTTSLDAIDAVRRHIRGLHPGAPLFLFGHSRGSFLAQHDLFGHGGELAGVILSAGTADLGPLRVIGLNLLRVEALIAGRQHRSALAEALSFKDFNRRFRPARTAFDWLSRDPDEVDRYVQDPLCGFRCSAAIWIELLRAGGQLRDPARLARIPKSLPVLTINGSADPACRGAVGARSLTDNYRSAGLTDVTARLYEDGRHELLNDICREQVTADLLAWLDAHSAPAAA
ncbi:MAG: alpha/beta hydrolase [Nevskiales bacterium]|nr:alpha/beta hydrolase [Nevskiales bacterium]